MEEMTLTVEQAARRLVTQAILDGINEFDLSVCIRQALGEEFGNLYDFDKGKQVVVDWERTESEIFVSVQSESQKKNYQILQRMLDEAKEFVRKGEHKSYSEYKKRCRGLGLLMIAGLSSETYYTEDGRLVMIFSRKNVPDPGILGLIEA